MKVLKKWLNGDITWKEEKALREKAQGDAFLADALNGYEQFITSDHSKKIDALNQKLRQKQDTSSNRFLIRAIAASSLFILSAGLLWWSQQLLTDSEPSLAESISIEQQLPPTTKKKATNPETKVPTPNEETIVSDALSTHSIKEAPKKERANKDEELNQPSPTPSYSPKPDQLSTIQPEIEEIEEIEEASAYSSKASDDVPSNTIFKSKRILEEETSFNEVKKARRKSETIASAPNANEGESEGIKSMMLRSSRHTIFNTYVQKNIQYPTEAKKQNIHGVVKLQFSVNEKGLLEKVFVLDSLGYGCEEEAIRLLESGPIWYLPNSIDTCAIRF